MIRKLTEKDRAVTYDFVKEKPSENLFIIGDIEAFGFNEDFQELWGEFDSSHHLKAVLLRYYSNFIIYAPEPFDVKEFADIVNHHPEFSILSGLKEYVEKLKPLINKSANECREFYYAKCVSISQLDNHVDVNRVKAATLTDVDRIINLHMSIPEFQDGNDRNLEGMKKAMKAGVSRTYYIEEDGQIVSSVSTAAENTYAGMVVGVCTSEGYKRKGYSTRCLTKLCGNVLNEGKQLCLFYDNPDAGKIYKRIGFEDIGKWVINSY